MERKARCAVGIGLIFILCYGLCESCDDIVIQNNRNQTVNGTVYTTRGALVILVCNGTCQGEGFTPNLKWYIPSGEKVSTFPGRIMSTFENNRRNRKLYVQRFRWRDQGTYSCEGQIHGQFRKTAVKVLIRGNSMREITTESTPQSTSSTTQGSLPLIPNPNIQ